MQWKQATSEDAGNRLDVFLAAMLGVTRSRAHGLIAAGCVVLNGEKPVKTGVLLRTDDVVEASLPIPVPLGARPQAIPLRVVYQDADIAVIDKARGMVVHPAAGHGEDTLVNALLAVMEDLSGIGGVLRPGIVHRLDKDTTGLLVVAKNDAAHIELSRQIKQREAGREYVALAHGSIAQDEGVINAPIARHVKDRKRMAVVAGGREAITYWRVIERLRGCTLLRVKLQTGRTHQIRVHMRHIGHPLLGDPIYGIRNDATPVLMLHASQLSVRHPGTDENMVFTASAPEDFIAILRARGGTWDLGQMMG